MDEIKSLVERLNDRANYLESAYAPHTPSSVQLLKDAATRIAELKAENDAMLSALAECRDAFPIPEAGSPIEGDWLSAMADPLEVPGYVRAALAKQKEKG